MEIILFMAYYSTEMLYNHFHLYRLKITLKRGA